MTGIYQEIWNADQEQNGVEALRDTEEGSQERGYVKVNSALEEDSSEDLRVLNEVHIPQEKMLTYELCRKLFNNYTLAEPLPELDTPEERQEVHDFIDAILETEPMEVARSYIARETGSTLNRERWHSTITEMWFRRFSSKGDPHLSGFEHVVVGEQEKSKVQGYHFWWKYYLDDGFGREVDDDIVSFPGLADDRITYHGSKQKAGQGLFPESVTISYRWYAPDYDAKAVRPLFKKIGGFFVGCSVEGLMALATVRAHKGIRAPRIAVIEGARYDMKLFHSPNGQHIRTFYPIFLGAADMVDGGGREEGGGNNLPPVSDGDRTTEATSQVRIIGAMVNPQGDDVGFEKVTLVNAGANEVQLANWSLRDKNNKVHVIEDTTLKAGEFKMISLTGDSVQLSNQGGDIILQDAQQKLVHRVSYSKAQARNQGVTVLF